VLPLLPPLFNSTNDCVLIANYSWQNTCSRELQPEQPRRVELASASDDSTPLAGASSIFAHIGEDNASIAGLGTVQSQQQQ
jgi:hypothetical protein